MAYGTRIAFEAVRELAFGSISGTYAGVGSPLGDHIRILTLQNSCDQDLYVSFDGSTNHLRISENSFKLFDFSSNKIREDGLFLASGTQIYVKEVSSSVSSGTFWIEVAYGEGGK